MGVAATAGDGGGEGGGGDGSGVCGEGRGRRVWSLEVAAELVEAEGWRRPVGIWWPWRRRMVAAVLVAAMEVAA